MLSLYRLLLNFVYISMCFADIIKIMDPLEEHFDQADSNPSYYCSVTG